jgi:hypothetical protein
LGEGVRRRHGGREPRRSGEDAREERPATISAAMRAHSVEDYSIAAVLRLLRHVIAHEQG